MQAGVPQGSVLSPTLYNLYINDTSGVNLALSADDTCLYTIDLQHGLNSMVALYELWNIKINEEGDLLHSSN
jgi:hypothetical protein